MKRWPRARRCAQALVPLLAGMLTGCPRVPVASPVAGDAAFPVVVSPPERGRMVALLYASALRGDYEPCGCPSHPLGGIARRATVVDRARAERDGVVVVDAGNLLLPPAVEGAGVADPDAPEEDRRARLLLAGLMRAGLAAFSPGETDVRLGPDRLLRLTGEHKVPVVSANLLRGGKLLFPATRLIQVAGAKFGIFGLVVPSAREAQRWSAWGVQAGEPHAAARAAVADLRGRGAEIVIALVTLDGGPAAARRLFTTVSGVDFAVLGNGNLRFESPERAGETRLLAAFELGKQLGRLDLHLVGPAGARRTFVDRGERAQLLEIQRSFGTQLQELERRRQRAETDELRRFFADRIGSLNHQQGLNQRRLAAQPARLTGSWFDNALLDLDAEIPDHPGVAALVRAYNQENQRRAALGLPVGVRPRTREHAAAEARQAAAGSTLPIEPQAKDDPALLTYAGTAACSTCHQDATKFWQGTRHAGALSTLTRVKRQGDPGCVVCHTTGFDRPGGVTTVATATERFAGVGCESCHGPGLAHVTATDKRGSISRRVQPTVCLGCHTVDQTNGEFDPARFLPAVLGPGHGGSGAMSPGGVTAQPAARPSPPVSRP